MQTFKRNIVRRLQAPTIINIHLLLEACEYSSVSVEQRTDTKTQMTRCLLISLCLSQQYLSALHSPSTETSPEATFRYITMISLTTFHCFYAPELLRRV